MYDPALGKAISEVVDEYARKHPRFGTPMRCIPGRADRAAGRYLNAGKPKIIYDSKEIAEAAAAKLDAIPGNRPSRVYLCERSRHGHYHLGAAVDKKGHATGWRPSRGA